jgi:hypothetical protein
VTARGQFSTPVTLLRTMLSNCASVQKLLKAADAAAALAAIIAFGKDENPTRPFINVMLENPDAQNIGGGSRDQFIPGGQLKIQIEIPLSFAGTVTALPAVGLIVGPENFSASAWVKTLMLIHPDSAYSPYSILNADRLLLSTGAAGTVAQTIAVAAGSKWTFSVYVQAVRSTWASISFAEAVSTLSIISGPGTVNGNTISGLSATAWTRVQITTDEVFAGASLSPQIGFEKINGSWDINVWGAQLEAGEAATDYFPERSFKDSAQALRADGFFNGLNLTITPTGGTLQTKAVIDFTGADGLLALASALTPSPTVADAYTIAPADASDGMTFFMNVLGDIITDLQALSGTGGCLSFRAVRIEDYGRAKIDQEASDYAGALLALDLAV